MDLDRWQKVADISIKSIATMAIAVGTLWYTAQRFNTDQSKFCSESLDQTLKWVTASQLSDLNDTILTFRLGKYRAACGPLDEKLERLIKNAWIPAQARLAVVAGPTPTSTPGPGPSPSPSTAPPHGATMWVATSRRNDPAYSAVNFDVQAGDKGNPDAVGNVIQARWFVNVRARNTPVGKGDNPVIDQLLGGECVRVLEHQSGTLNEWARIERTPCPGSGA